LAFWALFPFLSASNSTSDRYKPYVWIGLGGALSLALVFLPYLVTGNATLFVRSTFLVPLAFFSDESGYAEIAYGLFEGAMPKWYESISQQALEALFWIIGFLGLLRMAVTRVSERHARVSKIIGVFAVAIIISLLASGHPWYHHLILLAPIFAIAF